MPFIRIDDVVLHYDVQGPVDRPAIVFANSLGTDFRIWDAVVDQLRQKLGPDCPRLVRYDKRGHGLSDAPLGPYDIARLSLDLCGLMDWLNVQPATIVGISVGGLIAQEVAASRGDLVKALMLCDTAHKIGLRAMWDERIRAAEQGGIEALAAPILERWFSSRFRLERADELAGWRNMLTRTPIAGYAGVCAALRDADLTARTRALALPVLCVCGAEDAATPPDLVRELAHLIEGAVFVPIEDAGHLPCIEQPGRFSDLLINFLRDHHLV